MGVLGDKAAHSRLLQRNVSRLSESFTTSSSLMGPTSGSSGLRFVWKVKTGCWVCVQSVTGHKWEPQIRPFWAYWDIVECVCDLSQISDTATPGFRLYQRTTIREHCKRSLHGYELLRSIGYTCNNDVDVIRRATVYKCANHRLFAGKTLYTEQHQCNNRKST